MQSDETFHDGKSETKTVVFAPFKPFRLFEPLKDMRQELLRNPDPGIGNLNLDLGVSGVYAQRYPATLVGKFDAVRDKIPDDLFESHLHAIYVNRLRRKFQNEINGLLGSPLTHRVDGSFSGLADVDIF